METVPHELRPLSKPAAGRVYYAGRDGWPAPTAGALRVRRIPRVSGSIDFASLADAQESEEEAAAAPETGPVSVWREYENVGPEIILGRERFGGLGVGLSALVDAESDSPLAHSCGPALRSAANGGPPEHATLVAALEHTARASPGSCGITFCFGGDGEDHFESYAELLREAHRLASVLGRLGVRRGDAVALQLVETRRHLHVVWACALGGFPSLTVAVAPKLVPGNAVVAKLVAAVAQLEARHLVCSDELVVQLQSLLRPSVAIHALGMLDEAADAVGDVAHPAGALSGTQLV